MSATTPPVVITCSPRRGGNTDAVAARLLTYFEEQALPLQRLFLRDSRILPCTDCAVCRKAAKVATSVSHFFSLDLGCPLAQQDDSATVVPYFGTASAVIFLAPIYFLHLPAHVKALIDRMQPFWHMRDLQPDLLRSAPKRPFFCVFVAGRTKGETLFSGSILSCRYAFTPLGFSMQAPLCLQGLDTQDAFTTTPEAQERVDAYAASILAVLRGRDAAPDII